MNDNFLSMLIMLCFIYTFIHVHLLNYSIFLWHILISVFYIVDNQKLIAYAKRKKQRIIELYDLCL